MSAIDPVASNKVTTYAYRPSLLGAPWHFRLGDDWLEWSVGQRLGRIALRDIVRLRMSYVPGNIQFQRFRTELWPAGAPKLDIVSTSWKSMFEQERLDRQYCAFIADLHHRLARANAATRFEQGTIAFKYWVGLAGFAVVTAGFLMLVIRALQAQAFGGAAVIAAFLALFGWQGFAFFRRNRPGLYRPETLPPELLPNP